MATIYDIAKAVGVTKTTVANALAGKSNVSDATRSRILQTAQEMGYRPNAIARSLVQRKTFTLALVMPTIANPFYPEIAEALQDIAQQQGYQTIFCNTHHDFSLGRGQLEQLANRRIDGCVIMGSSMDIADIMTHFQQGLPIVLCDWQEDEAPLGIPQVSVDFCRAGELAAQHLLDLGHQRLAVIVDQPQQALRLEGFRTALQHAGIPLSCEMIELGNSSLQSGYKAAKKLINHPTPPTAIFATTDWMAMGAIEAILDAGMRVPQDISVIGLDDIVVSAHMRPPLTTIAVPKSQLAQEATALLLSQINKDDAIPISRLVEPYLVARQSTAFLLTL